MSRIFVPTTSAEDWKRLLADPEKHWRTEFSAKSFAYCWQEANGFPPEIARLFSESGFATFQGIDLLLAIPEYQVKIPGGARPSQNDLFVLARTKDQLIVMTIEGKVSETFGPTLGDWSKSESQGKKRRIAFLKEQLGLDQDFPLHLRYQLIHRTASAVIEARRFHARSAVMIVHSFSLNDEWFEDYRAFLELFGVQAVPNQLLFVNEIHGISLYCGWARGDAKYLKK